MKLSERDRKLLWTRAGDRCSYRLGTVICDRRLTLNANGQDVVVGEECHIIGEKPGSARYLQEFPDRETYSNAILLCAEHHKLVDDLATREQYPAEFLREMKGRHEQAFASTAEPVSIRDSTVSADVKGADRAVGMDIAGRASLQNVVVRLRAENVKEASAVLVRGTLTVCRSTCESCGAPIPSAHAGPGPFVIVCPQCGRKRTLTD